VGAKNHYISRSVVPSGWYVSGGKKGKKSMFSGQISPCFMLFTPNKFLIFNILTGYFHSVFIPLHLCSCLCFAFYICFPAFRRAGYGYYYFFKYNIMI
jgi:hypothetical protein